MERYELYKTTDKIKVVSDNNGSPFEYDIPFPELAYLIIVEGLKNGIPSDGLLVKSENSSSSVMSIVSTTPQEISSILLDATQSYLILANIRYRTNNSNSFGKFALAELKGDLKCYDNGASDFEAVAVGDTSIRGTTPLPKSENLSMIVNGACNISIECASTKNGVVDILYYTLIAIKISK